MSKPFFNPITRKRLFFSAILFKFVRSPLNLHILETSKDSQRKWLELQEYARLIATLEMRRKRYGQKKKFSLDRIEKPLLWLEMVAFYRLSLKIWIAIKKNINLIFIF